MKQIFSGEVFEVLPTSNGIIFSYCKEVAEENIIVAYKMISFENGRFFSRLSSNKFSARK